MPSKYVNVNGVATLVHHEGVTTLPGEPPNTSQGQVVLFLHDAGGNGADFLSLMTELASTQSPVSFDMPGHGRSGGLDALSSVEEMADHAEALIDRFDLAPVVLVGEGMGAAVAAELAGRSEICGLVAVGDSAASFDVDDEIDSLSLIASGKARRSFNRDGYAPETPRSVYQTAFTEWVKTDPRATLGDRKAQAAWSLQETSDAPSLIIIGEHQDQASAAAANDLASKLGAYTETVSNAGSHAVIEAPEPVANLINSFIEGLA